MSDIVTLTCPCGAAFQATARGARAGRKWCRGSCQDKKGSFAPRRPAYMRAYEKINPRRGQRA